MTYSHLWKTLANRNLRTQVKTFRSSSPKSSHGGNSKPSPSADSTSRRFVRFQTSQIVQRGYCQGHCKMCDAQVGNESHYLDHFLLNCPVSTPNVWRLRVRFSELCGSLVEFQVWQTLDFKTQIEVMLGCENSWMFLGECMKANGFLALENAPLDILSGWWQDLWMSMPAST